MKNDNLTENPDGSKSRIGSIEMTNKANRYNDSTKDDYNIIAELYTEDFSDYIPLDTFLIEAIELLKERQLLDKASVSLGAGPGNDTQFLLDHGVKKIICIDFAENFINYMTEKFKGVEGVEIVCEDVSQFLPKLKNSSIALYVDSFCSNHLSSDALSDVIANISRTLVKGGLFTTVFFEGDYEGIEDEPYQVENDSRLKVKEKLEFYINYFSAESLEKLARTHGLSLIRMDRMDPSGNPGEPTKPSARMLFEKK